METTELTYVQSTEWNVVAVSRNGDKVGAPENIRACVPCTDDVLARYRQ